MDYDLLSAYVVLTLSLLALALYGGIFFWRVAVTSQSSPIRPPVSPLEWPWPLKWMVALTTATACLLVVQVVLGVSIGALALLADSAHGAADFATYTLAAFVEYFKFRFGAAAINARAAADLDRASASFSVLVVMATSICVCVEANQRLTEKDEVKNGLGSAMMVVAGLGMALNSLLLVLRSWMRKDGAPQPEDSPPIPDPSAVRARPKSRRGQAKAPRFCAPDGAMGSSLHAAFHPGCLGHDQGGRCVVQSGVDVDLNLNLYGVVLHVGTDVARTLLMLIAGALVHFGVLRESAAVDAICSCLIAAFVTLGSVWLLGVACRSVQQPTEALAASVAKDGVSYGAA